MIQSLAKTTAVIVGSTILATLAVNAVDMRGRVASTFLGGVLFSSSSENQRICPDNMVLVSQALVPFCIDVYEVSAGSECLYAAPTQSKETSLNLSDPGCKPESVAGGRPWVAISQHEAQQACSRSGKRLPTASEWYKAALGTPSPNGMYTEEYCNVARNRDDGVALTGGGMRCVSDAGAYDMIGNVWEWVDGVVEYGEWDGRRVPPTGYVSDVGTDGIAFLTDGKQNEIFGEDRFWSDASIRAGLMRGGYYESKSNAGLFATYAASPPTFTGDAVGFRCAVTPIQQ